MLDRNNLEKFADPRNYDIEQRTNKGIAFYSALAQETAGPVLEVACGTGRVSIPIARLGLDVTGLDIVPGMLEQARAKSAGCRYAGSRATRARSTWVSSFGWSS